MDPQKGLIELLGKLLSGNSEPGSKRRSLAADTVDIKLSEWIPHLAATIMMSVPKQWHGYVRALTSLPAKVAIAQLTPNDGRFSNQIDSVRNQLLAEIGRIASSKKTIPGANKSDSDRVQLQNMPPDDIIWLADERMRLNEADNGLVGPFEKYIQNHGSNQAYLEALKKMPAENRDRVYDVTAPRHGDEGFNDWLLDDQCADKLDEYTSWVMGLDSTTRKRQLAYTDGLNNKTQAVRYVNLSNDLRLALVMSQTRPDKTERFEEELGEVTEALKAATRWLKERT
jgi:hypothetical protein